DADALRGAKEKGYAEADPTDDVSGADAAAKMAILATVAFNSRYELGDVDVVGIEAIDPLAVAAARELEMVIRLIGAARLEGGKVDVRVGPALVAEALAGREVSISRLLQHPNGDGAVLHVVTHEAREGSLKDALAAISAFDEVRKAPVPYPVVSDRGVVELGWA